MALLTLATCGLFFVLVGDIRGLHQHCISLGHHQLQATNFRSSTGDSEHLCQDSLLHLGGIDGCNTKRVEEVLSVPFPLLQGWHMLVHLVSSDTVLHQAEDNFAFWECYLCKW